MRPPWYRRVKRGLAAAAQAILAAPLKLPPKVVMVAKYVALALGVLEAVENGVRQEEGEGDESK